jgi:hypothetical protein
LSLFHSNVYSIQNIYLRGKDFKFQIIRNKNTHGIHVFFRQHSYDGEIKWKTRNITVAAIPKSNIKIVERGKIDTPQGCCTVKIWPLDLWPWKSIGFQTLPRTMNVPSLVKIHWRMLILECSQGCYAVKIWHGDIGLARGYATLCIALVLF